MAFEKLRTIVVTAIPKPRSRRVPILNFAFFAKFRVGMLEAYPNQQNWLVGGCN
jgi:hypothetical protein